MDHICKICHWNQYNWCPDGKKISNQGNCKDWRQKKLSAAEMAVQKAIGQAAHTIDLQNRKDNRERVKRTKRKVKGGMGGA